MHEVIWKIAPGTRPSAGISKHTLNLEFEKPRIKRLFFRSPADSVDNRTTYAVYSFRFR